jgi:hypothetical protein
MKKLWITYAWDDNKNQDVDFITQELLSVGVDVRLDRWTISAGTRLWDQIQKFITSDKESDGWLMIATENSLASEPCREEFAYALDRALRTRGDMFPVIALFPRSVDDHLIPPAIKVRLYLSLTDTNWKERIKAALEHRGPNVGRPAVASYELTTHNDHPSGRVIVEIRPRAGRWCPVVAAVPIAEKDCKPWIFVEPSGKPTGTGMMSGNSESLSNDGQLWVVRNNQQATPTESLYVWFDKLPKKLIFGAAAGPHYEHSFEIA